jgi:hypothetical protein
MGRHDEAPKGIGAGLIIDAARRVYRNSDIAAWGLILDAEGQNEQLMKWYESIGFRRAKKTTGVLYAPFKSLIPELNPQLVASNAHPPAKGQEAEHKPSAPA